MNGLPVLFRNPVKRAVNILKNFPKRKFIIRVSKSGFSPLFFISITHKAGDRVSETTPDRIVETAIVSANCL